MKSFEALNGELLKCQQHEIPQALNNIKNEIFFEVIISICDDYIRCNNEIAKDLAIRAKNLAIKNDVRFKQMIKSYITNLFNELRKDKVKYISPHPVIAVNSINKGIENKIINAINNTKFDADIVNDTLETTIKELIGDSFYVLVRDHGVVAAALILQSINNGNGRLLIKHLDSLIPIGCEDVRSLLYTLLNITSGIYSSESSKMMKKMQKLKVGIHPLILSNIFIELIDTISKTLNDNFPYLKSSIAYEEIIIKRANIRTDSSWRNNNTLSYIDNLELMLISNIIDIPEVLRRELNPENEYDQKIIELGNLLLKVIKANAAVGNTSPHAVVLRRRKVEAFEEIFNGEFLSFFRSIKFADSSQEVIANNERLLNLIRYYIQKVCNVDVSKFKLLIKSDIISFFKNGLLTIDSFKEFDFKQTEFLTSYEFIIHYSFKLFVPEDFEGFSVEQIKILTLYRVLDCYKKKLFTPQDFKGFSLKRIEALTLEKVLECYRRRLFSPRNFKGFSLEQIEALTYPDACQGYKDGLFTLKNFKKFCSKEILYLPLIDRILYCYKEKLFTHQDLRSFNTEQIIALASKDAVDGYKKKLFTPKDFKGLDVEQIKSLTSLYAWGIYEKLPFTPQDFKWLNIMQIQALSLWDSLEVCEQGLFTPQDFKNIGYKGIRSLITFVREGCANKYFVIDDLKALSFEQIKTLKNITNYKKCFHNRGYSVSNIATLSTEEIANLPKYSEYKRMMLSIAPSLTCSLGFAFYASVNDGIFCALKSAMPVFSEAAIAVVSTALVTYASYNIIKNCFFSAFTDKQLNIEYRGLGV